VRGVRAAGGGCRGRFGNPIGNPPAALAVGADDPFEPERIVDALNRGGVRYVIVGGLAAGAHRSVVRSA